MKVIILAGGMGTRFAEETSLRPKPMIEIGNKPILWHIMKLYARYGIKEFIIALGYKGDMIKAYFANYFLHQSSLTIDLASNKQQVHSNSSEDWKISLIDTGLHSNTAWRIKQLKDYVDDEFCLTYGDGVSDVNINELIAFHRKVGKIATLTAIQPEGRFGKLVFNGNIITSFQEKVVNDWMNGGFFVCNKKLFDYIDDDENMQFEHQPLTSLANAGELVAYQHTGFWKCMDTLRDKKQLEKLYSEHAPWLN